MKHAVMDSETFDGFMAYYSAYVEQRPDKGSRPTYKGFWKWLLKNKLKGKEEI